MEEMGLRFSVLSRISIVSIFGFVKREDNSEMKIPTRVSFVRTSYCCPDETELRCCI